MNYIHGRLYGNLVTVGRVLVFFFFLFLSFIIVLVSKVRYELDYENLSFFDQRII